MGFDFSELNHFYTLLDEEIQKLVVHFGSRLKCGSGCADCCVDELAVWSVEAAHIKEQYSTLLQTAQPARKGKCAFLDKERRCRIYPHRPYVCRTQGLPLRWFVEGEGQTMQEFRDICPLNEDEINLIYLKESECWEIGPFEGRLAALQHKYNNGKMERVTLRSLFNGNPETLKR